MVFYDTHGRSDFAQVLPIAKIETLIILDIETEFSIKDIAVHTAITKIERPCVPPIKGVQIVLCTAFHLQS